ncbi:uncharacterized protein MELLADRAFT_124517 [Melampsora larici-populina 98AG31]|uniref:Secreted protein n=1 Tax=Melampsora larici-populina (strain 98AG31 / pathotype 3-4-7) TaxID=747676 RepID=F4SA33_MELLP|nr:uncharacterized protein MELLADRAFT_124517 [Melampsora larici-populina 98AG31]EGF98478.1 secreted protein [Melampsora larici-populina 98AG31]
MNLSIGTAIFVAFVSNHVFGLMTHSMKSKKIILAEGDLVKPVDTLAEKYYCVECGLGVDIVGETCEGSDSLKGGYTH